MSVHAMRARMAFVSLWDAADRNAHSGSAHAMRQEVERDFDIVDWFRCGARAEALAFLPVKLFYKAKGNAYELMREQLFQQGLARRIEAFIRASKPDLIFSPSSVPVARLDTDLPVFCAAALGFATDLPTYRSNPADRTAQQANALEAAA